MPVARNKLVEQSDTANQRNTVQQQHHQQHHQQQLNESAAPPAAEELDVALLQMDIEIGNPAANFAACKQLLEQLVSDNNKPDVIVLPELWNTGFQLQQIDRIADVEGRETKAFFSSFCKQHQVNIIAGSIAEKSGAVVRNTSYAFDRSGQMLADYSKLHLFRLMDEEKFLVSGDHLGEMQFDGHRCGMMICYDIRFPELSRRLALNGARILFIPAQWPVPRLHHWRTLLLARAIENQMFVVACNRVGSSGNTHFFGHSLIIDPWGDVLAEGGEQAEVVRAKLNMSQINKVRSTIPIFEDRMPSFY